MTKTITWSCLTGRSHKNVRNGTQDESSSLLLGSRTCKNKLFFLTTLCEITSSADYVACLSLNCMTRKLLNPHHCTLKVFVVCNCHSLSMLNMRKNSTADLLLMRFKAWLWGQKSIMTQKWYHKIIIIKFLM